MAMQLKSQGWKAIKLRAHYRTLKEDVSLVEAVVRRWVTAWTSWWTPTRRSPPARGSRV